MRSMEDTTESSIATLDNFILKWFFKLMSNKVIFIPLIIYLFLDVLELYTKESYLCGKIVLFVVIIVLGIYFKIFYKKK